MLPPPTVPAGAAGSILLVEEYSALATAFGALLRKSAPNYETRVVSSLLDAEAAVRERTPELLVIDVDPAPPRATAFFNRLKAAAPDLRVLVIGADDPGAVTRLANGPAAFQFIKKPFQVDDFGVAVRGLLEWPSGAGPLRDLGLVDLLVLHAVAGATMAMQVDAPDGRSGEIHLNDGRISHALVVGHTGAAALHIMLGWRAARIREIDRRTDAPRTISGPWQSVLLEALRVTKTEEPAPPAEPAAPPAPAPLLRGKKVLVIDDTELLLIFVEEVLSTAEPTLQIVTAPSGLAGFEKAITEMPDFILLDYSLPDITGDEVCRRLLADERTARLPVILMSGHVPEMLSVADTYENVVAAIPKPFLSTALLELIDRTLRDLPQTRTRRRKRAKPAATEPKAKEERRPSNGAKPNNERSTPAPPPTEPPAEQSPPPTAAEPPPIAVAPSQISAEAATPAEATPPIEEEPADVPLPEAQPSSADPIAAPKEPAPVRELTPPPLVSLPTEVASPPAAAHYPPPQPPPQRPAEHPAQAPAQLGGMTRAVMQVGARNVVVLTLPLEVVSMQFSPALQMRAIRARPISPTITLHVLPQAVPGGVIPEARFDIARVNLDTRGQIDTISLAPTTRLIPAIASEAAVSVIGLAVLLANGGTTMELMPAPAAPMRMQLTALFELGSVELSPGFRVAHLLLKWRGGNMHVTQQTTAGGGPGAGVTFETAQILLNRSGGIAEILLDAPA